MTAARTLLDARADALPVVDADGRLTGLVTARHCVELVAAVHGCHVATDRNGGTEPTTSV